MIELLVAILAFIGFMTLAYALGYRNGADDAIKEIQIAFGFRKKQ
jgi:hypothetical protein